MRGVASLRSEVGGQERISSSWFQCLSCCLIHYRSMSYMDATRYKSVPVIPKRCLLWDLTQPGSNSKNAGEINQMCV